MGRINDLRLGEAILLGVEPISEIRIDGLFTDAFTLVAETIESKVKLSPTSLDTLLDQKPTTQSILAVGYQDTDASGLTLPIGLTMIGATSDHLVVSPAKGAGLAIGAEVALQPNYSALMRVMNAPTVGKIMNHKKYQDLAGSTEPLDSDLALA